MTPLEIQFKLKRKKITQASIAEEARVTEVAISRVVHGKLVSKQLQELLASKIGLPVDEIFPVTDGDAVCECAQVNI